MVLAMALLLLLVITMMGLGAARSALMQQKLVTHQYDRHLAFEHAEAALRAAQARISAHPEDVARHCQQKSVVCLSNPFNDPRLPDGSVHTVGSGTDEGQFIRASVASGQPQYVIEDMGSWADPDSPAGVNQSANAHDYAARNPVSTYYRITTRSADPASTDGRMVVVLQATIRQH
ncbi:PilX N-terminal domain-containing pilus assembly protein [Dyella sp. C11]|uniref:pilus assembly PilX family protein n=1 Tax=Dyella sp. C11 TaxID=2126991 RepID=UPI000D651E0B|nr:PilX N-terminal domain-containing pilus assembly protein [Dyella sp. C11]